MDKIKDIKPLIEMSDYSLYIFIITLLLGLIIGYILLKKTYKFAKKRCKIDCMRYYFEQYKKIDWSNPKKAAYEATKYGMYLARDKRRKELFMQLRERLDKYKYKQEYKKVDSETLNYYNLYKQVCDESF